MSFVLMRCPNGSCNVATYEGDPTNRTDRCCPSCHSGGEQVIEPGAFWTNEQWLEWSNELASLIPEGDESRYSNPEGAQESIILDCLRAYVAERQESLAVFTQRVRAAIDDSPVDALVTKSHAEQLTAHLVSFLKGTGPVPPGENGIEL